MINCDEAQSRWHRRYDDGGVDGELERHLAQCEDCRRYADELDGIVGALDELRDASESVVASDAGTTQTGPVSPPLLIRLVRLTRAAAVLAIVASAAFYFVGRQADQRQPVEPGLPVVEDSPSVQQRLGITLRDDSAEQMMAVALPTSNPDVQMYRLYRTSASKAPDGS